MVSLFTLDSRSREGMCPAWVHTVWTGGAGSPAHTATLEPKLLPPRPSSLLPLPTQPIHTLCIPPLGEGTSIDKSKPRVLPEQPRNTCRGLLNMGLYDSFYLEDTAECFKKCGQLTNESCDLENLQR